MYFKDFKRIVFRAGLLLSFGLSVSLAATTVNEVVVHDDKPFPESITSTSDGALIIGGITKGMVYRAAPGKSTAEPWIMPGTNGLQRVLGVLADERSGTLWVCSNKQGQGEPTALKSFDLKTGAAKGSFPFPGDNSLCNDIAIGPDGSAYATDTIAGRILRLKRGASALDIWAKDEQLAAVDGIAFGDNSTVCVNTFNSGHLLRIPMGKDGAAGAITVLKTSQPLTQPDGMRPFGKNTFLMAEGGGRLDKVTVKGDGADIEVLKDGFVGPTAVTQTGNTAWVLEGKLKYMQDPKFKDQDPGAFKAYAVPLRGR